MWHRFWFFVCIFGTIGVWAADSTGTVENDSMYPPTEAAKPFINFDGAGFSVDGKRTYFSSGSIHYPRVPSELWRDRLLRLRQANFSAVETYAFWNFHEQKENEFEFTGEKDFGKFLDIAQELGLYATVRVGPYVCAEWDSGGYPIWLRFKPPFKVRENNPDWLKWSDHWYAQILPIVAQHQINRGGNVVMVQLENEHPNGWGVVTNNPYFERLHDLAMKYGIEVPHFMSGQHHGATPMPGNLDSLNRITPWITTEFWVGWYNTYGTLKPDRNREIEKAIWTIIAHGGGGYNFYMVHGGTDFGTWNNDEIAASYDDGAVIGQAGDLRPMYYRMKRQNQLTQSFPNILANGNDDRAEYKDFATGTNVEILGARKSISDAGTLVFVRNSGTNETTATFKSGEFIKIPAGSVYPLAQDVELIDGIKIADSTLPLLGLAHNDQTVTLVVYGPSGECGHVTLSSAKRIDPTVANFAAKNFATTQITDRQCSVRIEIPTNGVKECLLNLPGHPIRILAVNDAVSLYTWILGSTNRQYIVVGPAFVQDVRAGKDGGSVILERPYGRPAGGQVAVFGGNHESWNLKVKADLGLDHKPAPKLKTWKMSKMPGSGAFFDDSTWKHSEAPLQMGADGDISAFAWYRTSVILSVPASGILHLIGGDDLEIFVNGRHVFNEKGKAAADFKAGTNTIAVFASHHGRNKNYNYLGTLDNRDNKGLWGAASLEIDGLTNELKGWAMHGGVESELNAIKRWQSLNDIGNCPTFYQSTFEATPPGPLGGHPILRATYQGLSRGTFWINGHNLGRYPEKIKIDSLYIPECWLRTGENVLTVFDEAGASPRQVSLVVETAASREVIRADQTVDPAGELIVP